MSTRLSDYSLHNSWVTIGSFDGVHLGHQAIIKRLVDQAHGNGNPAVVITFHPHPAVFFKRAPQAYALTTPIERAQLLTGLGVDEVIQLEFNQELANLTASQFMNMLKKYIGITHLMVGYNFALGKDRAGNVEELKKIGDGIGIEIDILPPVSVAGANISSSQIRTLLQNHEITQANHCLGRFYTLTGEVVHGDARGRRLGFPTANIAIPEDRLIPGNGVYITRAVVNDHFFDAVTNIGIRPTFENPLPAPRIEPHLLDVKEDFYSQTMQLQFIDFIRPEVKFANAQELIDQINQDILKAREVLSHVT